LFYILKTLQGFELRASQ